MDFGVKNCYIYGKDIRKNETEVCDMIIELIAIVVTLVLTALMAEGGSGFGHLLLRMMDVPTLITLFLLSFSILLRNGMWKDFARGFKLLKKEYTCSLADLKRILDVVELLQKQIICAGVILMTFMMIVVLGILQDPAALGPNVAVILITGLYVAILEMLLLPMHIEAKRRIIDYMEAE